MYLLFIFLLLLLTPAGYLLFAPLLIEINSVTGFYGARLGKVLYGRVAWVNDELLVMIKAAFWYKRFRIFPIRTATKKQPKQEAKKQAKTMALPWKLVKPLIKTFRVKKCCLDVDTGDGQLNAILYPVFYGLSAATRKTFRVNFEDRNVVILIVENRLSRISGIVIKYFFTKKSKKWTI